MLTYFVALNSEDPKAIRETFYMPPDKARVGDEIASMYADMSRYRHVMNTHFPGQDIGLDLHTLDDSQIAQMKQHLATAKVTMDGNKATIVGTEPKWATPGQLTDVDWRLRLDRGKWKLDPSMMMGGTALAAIDNKVPEGGNSEDLAMFYIMRRFSPELRKIADAVESGRITTHDEAVKQAVTAVSSAFQSVEAEFSKPK